MNFFCTSYRNTVNEYTVCTVKIFYKKLMSSLINSCVVVRYCRMIKNNITVFIFTNHIFLIKERIFFP